MFLFIKSRKQAKDCMREEQFNIVLPMEADAERQGDVQRMFCAIRL